MSCRLLVPGRRGGPIFRVRLRGRAALAARDLALVNRETITLTGRWRDRVFYATEIRR
jgi:hypothetical protein